MTLIQENEKLLFFFDDLRDYVQIIKEKKETLHFKLSGENKCTFEFALYKDNQNSYLSIFVGEYGVEFCNSEPYKTEEDIDDLKEDIEMLLKSQVEEKIFFVNAKAKKIEYTINNVNTGDLKIQKGTILPFVKKRIDWKSYTSWI